MLEEHNTIDAIANDQDGNIILAIMDAGITQDSEERFSHLIEKLKCYLYFILEGDFKNENPGRSINDVKVRVMCRIPATDKMKNLNFLSNPENQSEGLRIEYQHFPGADED